MMLLLLFISSSSLPCCCCFSVRDDLPRPRAETMRDDDDVRLPACVLEPRLPRDDDDDDDGDVGGDVCGCCVDDEETRLFLFFSISFLNFPFGGKVGAPLRFATAKDAMLYKKTNNKINKINIKKENKKRN